MSRRRVSYFYDPDIGSYTYGLAHTMKPHRMKMTHELVSAYDMLGKMDVVKPLRCTAEKMTAFHTDEYIKFLSTVTPETADQLTFNSTRFLVPREDNPPFEGIFEFCSISAGGSIAASQKIMSGEADIAINWAGGLHHAKKAEASGFCYINDIVLGILELLRVYPRVLYIDIDIHHGDGVEEAFYTTDRVMACSFHKYGEFFPGTGETGDRGIGKGSGYSVNVPLNDGIQNEGFKSIFDPVMSKILDVYQPSVVVLQCGADSLAEDRLGCFNLTLDGHAHCVQFLRARNVPLVLLGGGGYTVKNVAKAWTYETACALGIEKEIDELLPWSSYFEWFGPRYRLEVLANNMEDLNYQDGERHIDKIRETVLQQLSELQPAPSVGLQEVPRESLGEHLGYFAEKDGRRDAPIGSVKPSRNYDLDDRLSQHINYVYEMQNPQDSPEQSDVSTSDTESDMSTGSHTRLGSRPMSIMTNKYLNLPASQSSVIRNIPDLRETVIPAYVRKDRRRYFGLGTAEASRRGDEEMDVDLDHSDVE